MGCQKDDSHSEQSVKAILESFLSCSVQDVQEYQNTYLGLTAEAVGDRRVTWNCFCWWPGTVFQGQIWGNHDR